MGTARMSRSPRCHRRRSQRVLDLLSARITRHRHSVLSVLACQARTGHRSASGPRRTMSQGCASAGVIRLVCLLSSWRAVAPGGRAHARRALRLGPCRVHGANPLALPALPVSLPRTPFVGRQRRTPATLRCPGKPPGKDGAWHELTAQGGPSPLSMVRIGLLRPFRDRDASDARIGFPPVGADRRHPRGRRYRPQDRVLPKVRKGERPARDIHCAGFVRQRVRSRPNDTHRTQVPTACCDGHLLWIGVGGCAWRATVNPEVAGSSPVVTRGQHHAVPVVSVQL